MTSPHTDRWVRLDGTTNTRDLGGLPTTDGGRTVPGRVLRSDNLQTLSDDDVRQLVEKIRLREVVDLRTTAEILLEGRGPLRAVPEVVHRHFSLLPERGHHTDVFAVEEDDPLHADLPDDDVRQLVEKIRLREVVDLRTTAEILLEGRGPLRAVPEVVHRHFSLLPERGHHTDVFAVEEDDPLHADLPDDWAESILPRQAPEHERVEPPAVRSYLGYLSDRADAVVAALRALAEPVDGASIVHCAAGKDRTGVVVALALAVAGVPHEEIVADYALTADVIDALVAKLAASPTYAEDMERRDVPSHTPRAETMDRVLALLDERHGGPIGWLDAHGFGPEDRAALRARLRD